MNLKERESEAGLHFANSTPNDVDWQKLWVVIGKGMPLIGLIFAICLSVSYLVIRYTKPLYESYSEIKLDHENQSNVLNLPEVENQSSFALISSEMELITSRMFFNKIIESVKLNPQYFSYGQFLVDEKYSNPPFRVTYTLKNIDLYNKKLDVTIKDETHFILRYQLNNSEVEEEMVFDQQFETDDISILVSLSPMWNTTMGSEFYFVINSHDALITYLEDNINVDPVNLDANIFRISFKDYNINKAHALVSAIDTLYYKYSLDEKNRANKNKIEYLNSQLTETETKLDNYEKYFEDVTITNKTVSLDEDVKRTVDLINGLDSQKVHLENRLQDLNNLAENIKTDQIVAVSTVNNKLPAHIMTLINELNLLLNEREKLALSYRENTYTYKTRQKEIDLIKADLMAQINDARISLEDDISYFAGQKVRLNHQLNQLPSKSTEYNKVKRFYSLYEEIYLSLMQSKNEFEIAIAGSTTKIKILSPATIPSSPIKPNQVIIYGLGTGIFLLFSVVFVIISYLTHNKINNVSEVERNTDATLLGSVPKFKSKEPDAKIIVADHPKSALSESLRSIRTNLEFMLPDKSSKVYSLTSTIGSEGKTFISTNLGLLLALAGKKVIVLDLDLRRPKVHRAFDKEPAEHGISTLLINKHALSECIEHSKYENLDFIGAGPVPPNPSELLLRDTFDALLTELKNTYDIIILDTPPIGIVTDGLLAMQKADLPIYVLRADYSKLAFIKNVNRLVASGRYPNLSVILNSVSNRASGYGYNYDAVYSNSAYYQK